MRNSSLCGHGAEAGVQHDERTDGLGRGSPVTPTTAASATARGATSADPTRKMRSVPGQFHIVDAGLVPRSRRRVYASAVPGEVALVGKFWTSKSATPRSPQMPRKYRRPRLSRTRYPVTCWAPPVRWQRITVIVEILVRDPGSGVIAELRFGRSDSGSGRSSRSRPAPPGVYQRVRPPPMTSRCRQASGRSPTDPVAAAGWTGRLSGDLTHPTS